MKPLRPLPLLLGAVALVGALRAQTPPTYVGRDPAAAWRAPAAARIEQIRQGDFTLRLVDAAGQPIAGVSVTVTQQRHAFAFGTALQMARLAQDTADNRIYRQKTAALFNAGSTENDLKWPPWIGEWGFGYTQTQTLAGLRWLANRGFQMRGHNLIWPGWSNLPNSVNAVRDTPQQSTIPQMALAHFADITAATRALTGEWDVLNEPYANHDLMDLFGQAIMVDWFKAARTDLPDAALYLNDYGNQDQASDPAHVLSFENTARYLLQNGAPLTGLGLQAHISASPGGIPDYLATLDRYAPLGLAIRITEFDVNTADDQLQADYARDFLTASFSHPSVVGFQFWGFWETAHWRPQAAMYRADWSEKPNGAAYRDLVFNRWWTRLSGATDAQGTYRGRGFYGDYTAKISVNGQLVEKTFSLRPGGPAPVFQLTAETPRLGNLSTRASVGGAAGSPAAGFVLTGPAPKLVLVRAAGPILGIFAVPGTLARPTLTLYSGTQPIATNTGWSTAANAADIAAAAVKSGAFAFAPGGSDSAILTRLTPGAYTARVTSADGGSGIALVEAYEVENDGGHFVNLSTLAFVGTGNAIVISGLVVTGNNARTYLIRAVGPGLVDFGVTGVLAKPSIVLMRGATPLQANDGWTVAPDPNLLAQTAARVGAFTLKAGSLDAAMVITLEPGAYTVLVTGANGGTGNCLVEIYEVATDG